MQQHRKNGGPGHGCPRQRGQRGFTIIEVMIVLTIVGIALTFGLPSMSAWLQSNQIRNAAESIQSGLQVAKSEAVRRNTNVQFTLTSLTPGGTADWSITCQTPSAECPGAGMTETSIRTFSSREGAAAARVAAPQATFTFGGTGRLTPMPAATLAIYVTNPNGGACAADGGPMRCLRIQVSPAGHLKMCDPALPSTNARGC